jgi:toxin FitB
MILLDTNVISESFRPRPNSAVIDWLNAQSAGSLFLCAPVLAELRFGVERLAAGHRKRDLQSRVDQIENGYFRGQVLPFDAAAAAEFGRLTAARERSGRRIDPMDAFIAAVTRSNGAALATRDVSDFADLEIELINPFEGP